jgi:hypothetical protein
VSGRDDSSEVNVWCSAYADVDDAADDSVERYILKSEQQDIWELEISEKLTSPGPSVSIASPWKSMKSPVRVY